MKRQASFNSLAYHSQPQDIQISARQPGGIKQLDDRSECPQWQRWTSTRHRSRQSDPAGPLEPREYYRSIRPGLQRPECRRPSK